MSSDHHRPMKTPSGRFSPLRYPGGKGKLARFVKSIALANDLSDGHYIEPYAGGAAVAIELLLTGVVKRITINDSNIPLYSFWVSALNETDKFCSKIERSELSVKEWDRQKEIYRDRNSSTFDLGFSFFYLNRTNRSGILNGGIIGGRAQNSEWGIEARFNRDALIDKIKSISRYKKRISIFNDDALKFLESQKKNWDENTLVYLDPPYYKKGPYLYENKYKERDHRDVAECVSKLAGFKWIVSYDDVAPIHSYYERFQWTQYYLQYSARNSELGREAMFFSDGLIVPPFPKSLREIDRGEGVTAKQGRPVSSRSFAALAKSDVEQSHTPPITHSPA